MILCTVKNTVDYTCLKKSCPLKSINHERWDLMDLWAELYCKFDVLSRQVFTVCFSNVEYTHKSLKPHRLWFILFKRQRFFNQVYTVNWKLVLSSLSRQWLHPGFAFWTISCFLFPSMFFLKLIWIEDYSWLRSWSKHIGLLMFSIFSTLFNVNNNSEITVQKIQEKKCRRFFDWTACLN